MDLHESTAWAFSVEITDFWSVHHFLTMKDKSVDIFRVERLTESTGGKVGQGTGTGGAEDDMGLGEFGLKSTPAFVDFSPNSPS